MFISQISHKMLYQVQLDSKCTLILYFTVDIVHVRTPVVNSFPGKREVPQQFTQRVRKFIQAGLWHMESKLKRASHRV